MLLQISKDGIASEYKEPFATIDCETKQDYDRLTRLLEIGKAAEKALDAKYGDGYLTIYPNLSKVHRVVCAEELIAWAESEAE